MRIQRVSVPDGTPPPGFPKWAWWTLFLATFMFLVPLTSPWWSTILRREIPGIADEDEDGLPASSSSTEASASPQEVQGSMLRVILYARLADQPGLQRVEREIPYVRGVVPQIAAAVSELAVAAPGAEALLPLGTRVLDVAYTRGGTVYIDFSTEIEIGRALGASEEKLLAQGIVATIIDNFSAVRRVVILVDGKTPRLEHLDLTRPLRRDDPVFAPEEAEPAASPGSLPVPADARPSGSPAPRA